MTITFDESTFEGNWYINGTLNNTQTATPLTIDWGSERLAIGYGIFNSDMEGAMDDVRVYGRALSAAEPSELYQMGAPVGSSSALPQGCPNIGDVCDEGTFYAGLSQDGDAEMFVAPEDAPGGPNYAWNDGGTNYVSVSTTGSDGDRNTRALVTRT